MTSNQGTLERLLASGDIDLARGPLFDRALPARPDQDFGRVEGMLLGLAIGDALGRPLAGLPADERRQCLDAADGYQPNPLAGGRAVGLPSDETQLAFWTLEQVCRDGALKPRRLMERLAEGRIFGVGPSTREALEAFRVGALPWERCGLKVPGSGALPRLAPLLLPHLAAGGTDLWVDLALATLLTHNDSAALSAGLAWGALLWELLAIPETPAAAWWEDRFQAAVQGLEIDPTYRLGGPAFRGEGRDTLAGHLARCLRRADAEGWDAVQAGAAWGSGSSLLEVMPTVLFILGRHADDPREALRQAVLASAAADRAAALVGMAVGALHGHDAFPAPWVQDLLGRTAADDDGQVFRLLALAGRRFGGEGAGDPALSGPAAVLAAPVDEQLP